MVVHLRNDCEKSNLHKGRTHDIKTGAVYSPVLVLKPTFGCTRYSFGLVLNENAEYERLSGDKNFKFERKSLLKIPVSCNPDENTTLMPSCTNAVFSGESPV